MHILWFPKEGVQQDPPIFNKLWYYIDRNVEIKCVYNHIWSKWCFSFSYDECVGQGTQIYVPTDDPPPYSLTDPCRAHYHRETEDLPTGASWVSASSSSQYPTRLQDFRHQPIASISLSALPFEEAPPYEAVVSEQNQPLPLMPLDLLKHTTADSSPQDSVSHRIL